jgi:YVTN family beta-propeller protein
MAPLLLGMVTPPAIAAAFQDSIHRQGIAIDVAIDPVSGGDSIDSSALHEGDRVTVRFRLSDAKTAKPYRGANPAAWMDWTGSASRKRECSDRAARYLSGSLFDQPNLDLNVFYVLALNADPTITVVDPLFGFGGTKLLALIVLDSPGEDWAIDRDDQYLYVSLPDSDAVAVIDTDSWRVHDSLKVGARPRRIAFQPDGAYLWVASGENAAETSGVDVIRVADGKLLTHIATGAGIHDLAFTRDNEFAFVTNRDAGTVSVIDIRTLVEVKELATGSQPVSIGYSSLAQAAYVAHYGDGVIAVIDGQRHVVLQPSPRAEPGLAQVRITPDGQYAFAPNPARDTVAIIDTASNRLIHTAHVLEGPDQISFTNENAYIRHRNSDTVLIIPLSEVGKAGLGVSVVDFPGGQHVLGRTSRTSVADAIVQASGHYAVLVANPGDQAIYYYKEGMAAPMGTFSNYGREPRATMVVERNLRERKAGEYQTSVILRQAGDYQIVFYLDTPQIVHCFDVSVAANPARLVRRTSPPVEVQVVQPETEGRAAEPIKLAFRLTDRETGRPVTGLPDVRVLVFSPAWQSRFGAVAGPDGIYAVETTIPEPGTYSITLSVPSQGIYGEQYQWLTVHPAL